LSSRPFKIVINSAGERVRQDLTDEEIADAQRRTAEEQAQQQARQARADKQEAMMRWLEEQYDNRNNPPPAGRK